MLDILLSTSHRKVADQWSLPAKFNGYANRHDTCRALSQRGIIICCRMRRTNYCQTALNELQQFVGNGELDKSDV